MRLAAPDCTDMGCVDAHSTQLYRSVPYLAMRSDA